MIELTKDESMLLAITKGWEHKEVPVLRDKDHDVIEDRIDYIRRVCAHRCGCPISRVDVWGIYAPLAEKVLTSRDLVRAFEYTIEGYHTWTNDPLTALLNALQMVKVKDSPDEILVKMDMEEVVSMVDITYELKGLVRETFTESMEKL